MSRASDFERILLGEQIETPAVISRVDMLWNAIVSGSSTVPLVPATPIEKYLANIIDETVDIPQPQTRIDTILYAICTEGTLSNFSPMSENETFLLQILTQGIVTRNMFDINGALNYICDGTLYIATTSVPTVENGILTVAANAYLDYAIGQKIVVESGCTYKVEMEIINYGTGSSMCVGVSLDGIDENQFICDDAFIGNYEKTFTIPDGKDWIVLGFSTYNGTGAQITNIKMKKVW